MRSGREQKRKEGKQGGITLELIRHSATSCLERLQSIISVQLLKVRKIGPNFCADVLLLRSE